MICRSKGRRESALEAWCVKTARLRGIVTAKMTLCDGIPDRIFFIAGGSPLIVEFKAAGLAPEELQNWYLKTLTAAGYKAVHCDTKEKFIELLEACACPAERSKMRKSRI